MEKVKADPQNVESTSIPERRRVRSKLTDGSERRRKPRAVGGSRDRRWWVAPVAAPAAEGSNDRSTTTTTTITTTTTPLAQAQCRFRRGDGTDGGIRSVAVDDAPP